ncbi:hypothetical protein GCM10011391_24530 [Pullulanibacillus camelliae]|uniref:DUF2812 domain-containing protein n=1 Tax=Pullulanibacillus camelliae TaxID=1707096 RepID=A0A8J3DVD7_9BACL|nr:DUF2812 domain-containing protein [Pullulanibacillus camelliae]GGE44805.1 hypothetical protein GCM10011391_24530 [Pullulanibacillus camelliae]
MMSQAKKVLKMFPVWQMEEEEQWLSRMAQQGWQLTGCLPVIPVYIFEEQKSHSAVFKIDLQPELRKKDRGEYKQVFADSGWEFIIKRGDRYYFQGEGTELMSQDIYTDKPSKLERYKKQTTLLSMLAFIFCLNGVVHFLGEKPPFNFMKYIDGLGLLITLYGLTKLKLKMRGIARQQK